MGGNTSMPQEPDQIPPGPSYAGPVVEYAFMDIKVAWTTNVAFCQINNMITTDVDTYYPILGQKYAEGFRMSTFYRIPVGMQRQGLFNMSVKVPFQGVFYRYPQIPNQERWQLRVVKSVMVAHVRAFSFTDKVVGDTSHIHQAIAENTQNGGRLICIQVTGQQGRQGFSAAMRGETPKMGVDLFFETPANPMSEQYVYQAVPCPVTIQRSMQFMGSGVVSTFDWNGMLASHLSQGWRLVEIFFDMGQQRHGAFSTSASLNSVWFFEKPASRAHDNRPAYEGTIVTHYITITGGFSGARTKTNWESFIQEMGNRGWEFACFVETPEANVSGFQKAKMKVLMFFQRPIFR